MNLRFFVSLRILHVYAIRISWSVLFKSKKKLKKGEKKENPTRTAAIIDLAIKELILKSGPSIAT